MISYKIGVVLNRKIEALIKNYTRDLTPKDKNRLTKRIEFIKKLYPKTIKSILLKVVVLIGLGILLYTYFSLWLLIPILIVAFFMIWMLVIQIKDSVQYPKRIQNVHDVINSGVAEVTEIHIDRYIKINNYNDEGNHFIIEYDGKISLVGGQEFLGIRKLTNHIQQITIMNAERNGIYDERIVKSGDKIVAYHTFKKGVPETLFQAKIWDALTSRMPFEGKLEDFDIYITKDKSS